MTNLELDSSRKKEKDQINKIRNEKGEVTTDNAEIQRIIKETIMNNHMAIKWITWKKWTDSHKSSVFQD